MDSTTSSSPLTTRCSADSHSGQQKRTTSSSPLRAGGGAGSHRRHGPSSGAATGRAPTRAPRPRSLPQWDCAASPCGLSEGGAADEVDLLQTLECEGAGGAIGHVDHEGGTTPALVLLGLDVDGRPADLTEFDVLLARQQLGPGQAPRRGPVTTASGLKQGDRPLLLDQAIDQIQGLGCGAYSLDRANRSTWQQITRSSHVIRARLGVDPGVFHRCRRSRTSVKTATGKCRKTRTEEPMTQTTDKQDVGAAEHLEDALEDLNSARQSAQNELRSSIDSAISRAREARRICDPTPRSAPRACGRGRRIRLPTGSRRSRMLPRTPAASSESGRFTPSAPRMRSTGCPRRSSVTRRRLRPEGAASCALCERRLRCPLGTR